MDLSLAIGILVYVILLVMCAISIAHKTLKVLDLVIDLGQEIAGISRPQAPPPEVLGPEALTHPMEQYQEHFSGRGA